MIAIAPLRIEAVIESNWLEAHNPKMILLSIVTLKIKIWCYIQKTQVTLSYDTTLDFIMRSRHHIVVPGLWIFAAGRPKGCKGQQPLDALFIVYLILIDVFHSCIHSCKLLYKNILEKIYRIRMINKKENLIILRELFK